MKPTHFLLLLALSLTFSSCSLNYYYTQRQDKTNTGKVQIIPTTPVYKTYVTLNDSLIIENKNVKSLTLENLPYGDYKIHFCSYSAIYKTKLEEDMLLKIEDGKCITKIVSVPPASNGYWVYAGLLTSAVYLVLLTQGY